jgi:ATP synthase protein I
MGSDPRPSLSRSVIASAPMKVERQDEGHHNGTGLVDPWSIVSNLIAGIVIYGGLGFLVGEWLNHPSEGAAVGILVGLGLAGYLINHKLRTEGASLTKTKGPKR